MTNLCCKVLAALSGRTLVTAESCTGGAIGAALTAVPGSSAVYKGGIVSYTNWVKENLLDVDPNLLNTVGAISAPVAEAMANGAKKRLQADVAVSVTGLAGPSGDEYGNPVGTVFVGYCDDNVCLSRHFVFEGDRDAVRWQATEEALKLVLQKAVDF